MKTMHKIDKAAVISGFIASGPATAHPFELWRESLGKLPIGRAAERLAIEHRPERLCGWPVSETTVWAALYPAPPFESWPEGHGEVSGYYFASNEARNGAEIWEAAVNLVGYETMMHIRPPLPARAVAVRAGLGACGRNGLLITPFGSFVYIAVMLVHAPPPAGTPGPEADQNCCIQCGQCRACQDACPVGAISEKGIDALKCLAYSMSHKHLTPETHYPLMGNRIHGCDDCQRVCPRNEKVKRLAPAPNQAPPFELEQLLCRPDLDEIGGHIGTNLAKEDKLRTQAAIAAANTGRADLIPAIKQHINSSYEPLRKASAWALRRLHQKTL